MIKTGKSIIKDRWSDIKNRIKDSGSISDEAYENWIAPLEIEKVEDGILYLMSTRNYDGGYATARRVLRCEYASIIKTSVYEVTGKYCRIVYEGSFIDEDEKIFKRLISCPSCGKAVSWIAKMCPNCGFPGHFLRQGEEVVELKFAGTRFVCPVGYLSVKLAGLLGRFIHLGKEAEEELLKVYNNCRSIGGALEVLPHKAQRLFNDAYYEIREAVLDERLDYNEETYFLKTYYYSYDMAYEKYYDEIVAKYAGKLGKEEELQKYQKLQRKYKGRWKDSSGNVRSVIESILTNASENFVSCFGNGAEREKDEEPVISWMQGMYASNSIRKSLCNSLNSCIVNMYLAVVDCMKRNRDVTMLDAVTFSLDHEKADDYFEEARIRHRINHDTDTFVSRVAKCIRIYPGDKRYYDSIMDRIYDNLMEEDFCDYLSYWGITDFYRDNNSSKIMRNPSDYIYDPVKKQARIISEHR